MGTEGQRRGPIGKRIDPQGRALGVKAPEDRLCCGGVIKAQLFESPNPCSVRLVAALWYCPRCGQIETAYVWKERKRVCSAKPSRSPHRIPLRSRERLEA